MKSTRNFGLAGEMRALTLVVRDATRSEPVAQRKDIVLEAGKIEARIVGPQCTLYALDGGPAARRLVERMILPVRSNLPRIGPFAGLSEEGGFFTGFDNPRLVGGPTPWLAARVAAAPAPQPPAAAWFSFDAGPLLARYATLSGPQADPAKIGAFLGAGWRGFKPVMEGRIGTVGTEITGSVSVTGAAPCSPLLPLSLLAGGTAILPFGDCASWPLRRPVMAIPPSADRVASLSIGLTLPPPARPFTKAVTEWDKSTRTMERDLVLRMLEAAWSGDLALEIRPGAPLPRAALVLGLRPGSNPVEAVRQIAVWLKLPQETLDQPGPLPKSLSGLAAGGQLTLTAYADRLVATWNAEPADWPGLASAAAAADSPACAAVVDLPALARTWGPMALALVPAEHRRLVPPLPVLLDHLPVWSLRWDATRDGCRIEERGLPLVVLLTAAAAMRMVIEADPELDTQPGAPAPQSTPPAVF